MIRCIILWVLGHGTQPAVVANVQVFDKAQDETLHVRWLCEQDMAWPAGSAGLRFDWEEVV